jgi:hypothetical protein
LLAVPTPSFGFALGSVEADAAAAVVTDADGDVYVAGNIEGATDVAPGPTTLVLDPRTGGGPFVAKYTPQGRLAWARQFEGAANGLARQADNGNLALTLSTGRGEPAVFGLDPGGDILWRATLRVDGFAYCKAITFDGRGDLIAVGSFFDEIDLDPGPGRATVKSARRSEGFLKDMPSTDAFIVKLSARGKFLWGGALASGGGFDEARGVAVDAAGNVYVAGEFAGRADFDPSSATSKRTSAGGSDAFLSKLSADGRLLWTASTGGRNDDIASAVATTRAGDVYMAGSLQSTADLDPSRSVLSVKSAGSSDAFVLALTPEARLKWAAVAGGRSAESPAAIAVDPNDDAPIVTGTFRGVADFAPGRSVFNIKGSGGLDVFLWGLSSTGKLAWAASVGGAGDETAAGIAACEASGGSSSIVVAGTFASKIDLDPGAGTLIGRSSGRTDVFVAALLLG